MVSVAKSYMRKEAQIFYHIWGGGRLSYITSQPIPSEFPDIWGKVDFLFISAITKESLRQETFQTHEYFFDFYVTCVLWHCFSVQPQRKVERQVKVLIKNLAIFCLFPSKEFQNSAVVKLGADKLVTTQIWKLKNVMSLFSDVFSLPVHLNSFLSSLTVYILPTSSNIIISISI